MEFSKEKLYLIKGREGQYELTTENKKQNCFFMSDTCKYEYFSTNEHVEEVKDKTNEISGTITKEEHEKAKKFRHGLPKKEIRFFDKNWNLIR